MSYSLLEERRKLVERLSTSADILGVAGAYLSALALCLPPESVASGDTGLFISLRALLANILELLVLVAAHLSLRRNGHHTLAGVHPGWLRRLWTDRRETLLIDMGLTLFFWLVLRAQSSPLVFIPLYLLLSPLFGALFRLLLSLLLRSGLVRRTRLNLIVVGANDRGLELYQESQDYPFLGFTILGFVDSGNYCGEDIPLLGGLTDLPAILREKVVDVLVICLPIRSHYDAIVTAMRDGEDQGIPSECPGSFFPPNSCKTGEDPTGQPILSICPVAAPVSPLYKRVFDVVGALVLLAVFAPVMILAVIRIKLEDGGPLIYIQPRVGLNKRIFNLYKFRSMTVDAESRMPALEGGNEMDGPVFKISSDPRVTRVGRWLRKYNIDEMPQLFNVLHGEMSIVGPRPMSLRDYTRLTDDWTRRRFTVKPGLTCYWQTMPHRNAMRFSEWMTLDMRYIENCSLWEDVVICLRTIPALLRGSGV
jgi:exopolysaccharide biosynthesis polyprenyl glycosylphosphotransferase